MRSKATQLIVGLAVSAVFLWLAFRAIDRNALMGALRSVKWMYAVPFLAATMVQMYWRAFRWKVLLEPIKQCRARKLFGPAMIGFGFNGVFPARAGEFARAIALTRTEGIPFAAGFSTIILERLLDAVTLLTLFAVVGFATPFDPTVHQEWTPPALFGGTPKPIVLDKHTFTSASHSLSVFVGILLAGIAFVATQAGQRFALAVLARMPLPAKLRAMLEGLFHKFTEGLHALKSPRAVALSIIHSLIIWGLAAWCFQIMSWGFPGITLGFWQACAYLVITCIAISIPSAPGFWGLYEAGGIVAMLILGIVPNTPEGISLALGFTIVCHFLQWLPVTVIGLAYAAAIHVKPGEAVEAKETTNRE